MSRQNNTENNVIFVKVQNKGFRTLRCSTSQAHVFLGGGTLLHEREKLLRRVGLPVGGQL